MTLSTNEVTGTSTEAFDVRYRYFSGPAYNTLTLSAFRGVTMLTSDASADLTTVATGDVYYNNLSVPDSVAIEVEPTSTLTDPGTQATFPVGETPAGWIINNGTDAITPATGWTEVTTDINFAGSLTISWDDDRSEVDWSANISGYSYNETYYALGTAILCLSRTTWDGFNSGWVVEWMGVLDAGSWTDNWQHGQNWSRTVNSTRWSLEAIDAPHIETTPLNIASDGASVTASTTLGNPEDEIRNREYIGTAVNCEAANVVDTRLNTVWISQNPPVVDDEVNETGYAGTPTNGIVIDEIFFKPTTGWAAQNTWWVELQNSIDNDNDLCRDDWYFMTQTTAGSIAVLSFKWPTGSPNLGQSQYTLSASGADEYEDVYKSVCPYDKEGTRLITKGKTENDRGIICGNKRFFDEYAGGANKAQWVAEAQSWGTYKFDPARTTSASTNIYMSEICHNRKTAASLIMDFSACHGFAGLIRSNTIDTGRFNTNHQDWVVYGTYASASVPSEIGVGQWNATGVNITSMSAGNSIRRFHTGKDTNNSADWAVALYPRPGDKFTGSPHEWLQMELKSMDSKLLTDLAIGSGSIALNTTLGWNNEGGYGIIESDLFHYSSVSGSDLIDVTGVDAVHYAETPVFVYENSEAQTGWSCKSTDFYKRNALGTGAGLIQNATLWLSKYGGCRGYSDTSTDWESDYQRAVWISNGASQSEATENKTVLLSPAERIRTLLLVFRRMWGGTRAKLNEWKVFLDQASVANSGLADIPQRTCYYLLRYMIPSPYSWLDDKDIVDFTTTVASGGQTNYYGDFGTVNTGIAPFPSVLADVCKAHGCVISYDLSGRIHLYRDPWWPNGLTNPNPKFFFESDDVRGDIMFDEPRILTTGVVVNARNTEGDMLTAERVPSLSQGTNVIEFTDVTVADQKGAHDLAVAMWNKEQNQATVNFIVKGNATWIRPLDRIGLAWDTDNDETDNNLGTYLVTEVRRNWSKSGEGKKTWTCEISARKYS